MAKRASESVKNGDLKIEPDKYEKSWYSWLDNIKQIWWGHQVPFYYCSNENGGVWVAGYDESDARSKSKLNGNVIVKRDEDVLDTWFSSALLPFSCLGWPEKEKGLNKFYPLSSLVTGHDILFFWAARMTMLGLQLTDQLPFKELFLHSIVCDSDGKKMSKSVGNVIDPLDIIQGCSLEKLQNQITTNESKGLFNIEASSKAKSHIEAVFPSGIPQYGSDALRFSLLSYKLKDHYINFNIKDCQTNNLFCNKIWQATKFAIKNFKNSEKLLISEDVIDKWILSCMSRMVLNVNSALENKDFHLATLALKNFLYYNFCDIYIECVKPSLKDEHQCIQKSSILIHCLDTALRCLSPIMPFLSEKLYNNLPGRCFQSIQESSYPTETKFLNENLESEFQFIINIVNNIRRVKAENKTGHKKIKVFIDSNKNILPFIKYVETLTRTEISIGKPASNEALVEEIDLSTNIYLFIENVVDKANHNRDSLEKELQKLLCMVETEGYKTKAPEKVKEAHKIKASTSDEDNNPFGEYITSQYLILKNIFSFLSLRDLSRASKVCREWNRVSKKEQLNRHGPPQSYIIDRIFEDDLQANWPDYSDRIIPEVIIMFLSGVPSRKAPIIPRQSLLDNLYKKYDMRKCDFVLLNNYRSIVSTSNCNKIEVDHNLSNDEGNSLFCSFLTNWNVVDTLPTQVLILGSLPGVKFRSFQISSNADIDSVLEDDDIKGFIAFFHKADQERRFRMHIHHSKLSNVPAAGGTTSIVSASPPSNLQGKDLISSLINGTTLITFAGENVTVHADLSTYIPDLNDFFKKMSDSVGPLKKNHHRFAFCFLCVNRINAKIEKKFETEIFSKYFPGVPLYGYWSLGEMCCKSDEIIPQEDITKKQKNVNLPNFYGNCGAYLIVTIKLETSN